MPVKHNIYFNCTKCPTKAVNKHKNPMLFSGSGNNPGSLLSPGMAYSIELNKALIGRHGWKSTIYTNPINTFGQRDGAPGGSKCPPKNKF